MSAHLTRTLRLGLVALAATTACSGSDDAPKVPLAQAAEQGAQPDPLAGPARTAIDSGNALYRSGDLPGALAQYRVAAAAKPENAAPHFGIYMVARKLNQSALADSAMANIRARAEGPARALTDSAMEKMHTTAPAASAAASSKYHGQ